MRVDRRQLMKMGVVGGGLLGVTGTAAWVWRDDIRKLQPSDIADYLESQFDYLTFNFGTETLREFAIQYREQYREISRESWHKLRGGDEESYNKAMDHLAVTFLMSTDFFLTGADESKPVNYVMFYHPYISPCWNPLSMV